MSTDDDNDRQRRALVVGRELEVRLVNDDDAVGPLGDMPVYELFQAGQVETAVSVHGSNDCYDAALDHDVVWRKIG